MAGKKAHSKRQDWLPSSPITLLTGTWGCPPCLGGHSQTCWEPCPPRGALQTTHGGCFSLRNESHCLYPSCHFLANENSALCPPRTQGVRPIQDRTPLASGLWERNTGQLQNPTKACRDLTRHPDSCFQQGSVGREVELLQKHPEL